MLKDLKHMIKLTALILPLFLLSMHVNGGNNHLNFVNYGIRDGLSTDFAMCSMQDSRGFIWIGTKDGLNRFDGINFVKYNYTPGDTVGLQSNLINCLLEDNQGNIWIGTKQGLTVYNYYTNDFKTFLKNPNKSGQLKDDNILCLKMDQYKRLWVGTVGGLVICETDTQSNGNVKYNFLYLNAELPLNRENKNIWDLHFDKSDYAWVGTSTGLWRFKIDNSDLLNVKPDVFNSGTTEKSGTQRNEIWKILEDKDGHIILLSFNNMMDVISSAEKYNKPGELTFHHLLPALISLSGHAYPNPYSIVQDKDGYFWTCLNSVGLSKFKITAKRDNFIITDFELFKHNRYDRKSISNDITNYVDIDRAGSVWICTITGISAMHPILQQFSSGSLSSLTNKIPETIITAIEESGKHIIINSLTSGLFIYNRETNELKNWPWIRLGNNNYEFGSRAIKIDSRNNVWFAAGRKLVAVRLNELLQFPQTKDSTLKINCKIFELSDDEFIGLYSSVIFKIDEDRDGNIWFASGRGLNRYQYERNILEKMPLFVKTKNFSPSNIVRTVHCDKNGNIWVGTDEGLFQFNEQKSQYEKIKLSSRNHDIIVHSLLTEGKKLYVGTDGLGIFIINLYSDHIRNITQKDGLANNVIQSIEADQAGYLWCSTNYGISRINTKDFSILNFDEKDGLDEVSFLNQASLTLIDGNKIWGHSKGVSVFKPDQIKTNTYVPQVGITDIKIHGSSIFSDGNESFRKAIIDEKEIRLPFSKNSIEINFSSLNYISPEKNNYTYQLKGYDDKWVDNKHRRFALFANLDPGEYIFQLKGSNNHSVWNEETASFKLVIVPPFYKTWWFRGMLALVITTVILLINRARIKNIELRKEKEIALKTTELKEQFLANMSHEIRTPLNAIVGMTRLLRDKNPRPDQKHYLEAITQSSDNLLVIINDILDISKIEAGKIELEHTSFLVRKVIKGVYNTFEFKAAEKGINLITHVSDDVPTYLIGDPVRLSQILLNLVSNAIKFTSQGDVKLFCTVESVHNEIYNVRFEVIDSGIGIAPENQLKIFESFTQERSDTTRIYGGTGLGLAISKKLVEMHQGQISVRSQPEKGATFICVIPYKKGILEAPKLDEQIPISDLKQALRGIKILLVEDNEFNRMVAMDTLHEELENIEIDIAVNGKEAVEKAAKTQYDIVLMDIQMPEMNGYDASRMIRTLPTPFSNVRIMAMTASALQDEVSRCYDNGMNDFIAKPFVKSVLLEKMYTQMIMHAIK